MILCKQYKYFCFHVLDNKAACGEDLDVQSPPNTDEIKRETKTRFFDSLRCFCAFKVKPY